MNRDLLELLQSIAIFLLVASTATEAIVARWLRRHKIDNAEHEAADSTEPESDVLEVSTNR